jgi:hypothetical protein
MSEHLHGSFLGLGQSLERAGQGFAIHILNLPAVARPSAPSDLNVSVDGDETPQASLEPFHRDWSSAHLRLPSPV